MQQAWGDRELFVEETEQLNPTHGTPNLDTSSDSESEPKRAQLFGSYSEQLRTPGDGKGEVEKFLSSARQNPDVDVIQFWKTSGIAPSFKFQRVWSDFTRAE